ncbi:hypothetical protein [Hongsoonwoonella zoysiae]|nr:hypothetical protein [Hongsoonwoonella zoysiae]
MSTIKDIYARLFRVPLAEVLEDAKHCAHRHFGLAVVTITTENGR